jgi:hypothetical protein
VIGLDKMILVSGKPMCMIGLELTIVISLGRCSLVGGELMWVIGLATLKHDVKVIFNHRGVLHPPTVDLVICVYACHCFEVLSPLICQWMLNSKTFATGMNIVFFLSPPVFLGYGFSFPIWLDPKDSPVSKIKKFYCCLTRFGYKCENFVWNGKETGFEFKPIWADRRSFLYSICKDDKL